MDWFLYDIGLRHERVKENNICLTKTEKKLHMNKKVPFTM